MQCGLYFKKSYIASPMADNGVSARKYFYADDIVLAFFGFLICQDLSNAKTELIEHQKALHGVTAPEIM